MYPPHAQSLNKTWLACAGLLAAELEFLMGTRRSRATFQPCWLDATFSPKRGIVPGSTFSFPTEIQGHQSLCWARGSNVFLWRSSSWKKGRGSCLSRLTDNTHPNCSLNSCTWLWQTCVLLFPPPLWCILNQLEGKMICLLKNHRSQDALEDWDQKLKLWL